MNKELKTNLTKIGNQNEYFAKIMKKLVMNKSLTAIESSYILTCAMIFIKEYEKDKYSNVLSFDDVNRDLFELPVYYHIAHCIPADCTFWGETATIVDNLWNMKEKIFHNNYLELVVGDVIWIENVFNLITTERKHLHPTIDDLRSCVENLAIYCFENQISHLAMPRIGCGHNGLKWEEVRPMIVDTFNSVYKNKMEDYNIEDDDVINNYRIDIIFCYR